MLVPTTVGMLQAPGGLASSGEEPNLADSLACVYYLRAIKALAFADALDDTMRLDMYRTMVSSVSDARHQVALEAMQCLLDHPRWEGRALGRTPPFLASRQLGARSLRVGGDRGGMVFCCGGG